MNTKNIIQQVKDRLLEVYKPDIIFLFGSYVWGRPDSDSDIDIMIVVKDSDLPVYKRPEKGYKALKGIKKSVEIIIFTEDEFIEASKSPDSLCHKLRN